MEYKGVEYKNVGDFLLHGTKSWTLVKFTDGGWQVGLTQIDDEDLFTRSLDRTMLSRTKFEVSEAYIYLAGGVQVAAIRIELDP